MGQSIKDVRSQGGVCSVQRFVDKGERVLQTLGAKNIEFFEIYGVSARTKGEGD